VTWNRQVAGMLSDVEATAKPPHPHLFSTLLWIYDHQARFQKYGLLLDSFTLHMRYICVFWLSCAAAYPSDSHLANFILLFGSDGQDR
jgi:hypothetical protein